MTEELNLELTQIELNEVKDQIVLPKPLLSVCVIATENDKETYGKLFLNNLPKSPDIELILVTTIKDKKQYNKVIQNDTRLITAEHHYKTPLLDFAAARNYTKSLAKGDWIMSIDMDEVLPIHSHNNLFTVLKQFKDDKEIKAMRVGIVSCAWDYIANNYSRTVSSPIRIFKNLPELNWTGRLHEVVLLDQESIIDVPFVYEHFGYAVSLEESIQKFERNLRGIAWELTENQDRLDHFILYMQNTINVYQQLKEIKNKGK